MTANNNIPLRIIDANVNRAREALRVLEDFARLGLDDAGLSGEIKAARHAVAAAVSGFVGRQRLTSGDLLAARDITGDVGTTIDTASEFRRRDEADVTAAAGKRLGEALRTIEEYGKTLDPQFAGDIEGLRYRGYEIERRLALTCRAIERFAHVRLYVIITESWCAADWFATAEAALRGGADCIQLREKALCDRELLNRARRLSELCRRNGALLIVNDRADIAAAAHAHGVHLGQDDLPVTAARRILPPSAVVGVSTHTVEQVERAAAEAPDYLAVGPMFDSATKPQPYIAGPATLAAARRRTALPLVAIGGITSDNAEKVLAAGLCALCVCQAVTARPDPETAARELKAIVDDRSQHVGGHPSESTSQADR